MVEKTTTPSGPFALHLRIRVLPGRHADLLAFLREAIPFYEAPGGIRVLLLQRQDDLDEFIEVVEYANQDAYERDQARVDSDPAMKERIEQWHALLAGPVTVEIYRVLEVPPATAASNTHAETIRRGEPS